MKNIILKVSVISLMLFQYQILAQGCTQDYCYTIVGAPLFTYGYKNINTNHETNCDTRLFENCNGTVLNSLIEDFWGNDVDIHSTGAYSASFDERAGATAHWGLERTYDFFATVYGRNSYDNNHGGIFVVTDAHKHFGSTATIFFPPNTIVVTRNLGGGYSKPPVFLDYIAHEFTHGIIDTTSSLGEHLSGEPPALAEAFADMMGTSVEKYWYDNGEVSSWDYVIGGAAKSGGERDMSDPNGSNHAMADTYHGTNWDFGGSPDIYANMGPADYWFYLLSHGGSGTNDNSDAYCVTSIGFERVRDIVWRTLTAKATHTMDYSTARAKTIEAAEDLFGTNSYEAAQVAEAWHAVGVGSHYSGVIEIKNYSQTITTPVGPFAGFYQANVNANIKITDVSVGPGSAFLISSSSEIEVNPETTFNNGVELSIGPGCTNGARISNPNYHPVNSSDGTDQVEKPVEKADEQHDLSVFPNPNNGLVNVLLDNKVNLPQSITVYDSQGRLVSRIDNPANYELVIDLTKFNVGLYVINITYVNGTVSKKVVKNL